MSLSKDYARPSIYFTLFINFVLVGILLMGILLQFQLRKTQIYQDARACRALSPN